MFLIAVLSIEGSGELVQTQSCQSHCYLHTQINDKGKNLIQNLVL